MANICVTGIWHQGAVVSACLAELGNNVHGVCDETIAAMLNKGIPPVYEPELPEIIKRNISAGRLGYSLDFEEGLKKADFVFICTDTPVDENDESDINSIREIAEKIGRYLESDIVLCVTAQVPIGTSEALSEIVRKNSKAAKCDVAYVPEFLRLGIAVETFRNADRIVIGCDFPNVAERIAALYRPLGRPIVFTDIRSAEMAKHASNAYLSTSISFINEIADLCEVLGADASEVSRILKIDKRIGKYAFLSPGLGFAGGTLGREIKALQKLGSKHETSTPLMDTVWRINSRRSQIVGRRLSSVLGDLAGHQIGILGLTYKPGTSTMRRAISIEIIRDLIAKGATIKSYDPLANLNEVTDFPSAKICEDPYEVAHGSSAIVLVTEWKDIDNLDLKKMRNGMKGNIFLDTRNWFDPGRVQDAGFRYFGIGR